MSTTVHRFVDYIFPIQQPLTNFNLNNNCSNNMYPTSAGAFASNLATTSTTHSGGDFNPFLPGFSPTAQFQVVDSPDLLKKVLANLMLVSGQCPDVLAQTLDPAVLNQLLRLSDQRSARLPPFPAGIPPLVQQHQQPQALFPGIIPAYHGALSTLQSPTTSTPTSPTMLKPVAVFPGALSAINLPLFGMGPVSPLSSQMSDKSSSFFSSGTPSLYSGDSRRSSLQSEGDVKYQQSAFFLPGAPHADTVLATAAAANIFAAEQRQLRSDSTGSKPHQQRLGTTSESSSFETNIPCSSIHVDDASLDLEPATTLRGGVPPVNKLLLSAKTSSGSNITEYPEACSSPGARKRYQNRLAAYRYRLKRKFERERKYREVISLSRRNKDLKTEFTDLEREISYLKDLTISIASASICCDEPKLKAGPAGPAVIPQFITASTSFVPTASSVIVTKI